MILAMGRTYRTVTRRTSYGGKMSGQKTVRSKRRRGIYMSYQIPVKGVFFHVIEGNKYAFADERTKKYLLDILENIHEHAVWHMYAFCITDQNAYFIVETQNMDAWMRDIEAAVRQFRDLCGIRLPKWWSDALAIRPGQAQQLQTEKEIKEYCCSLHRLPISYGYSEKLCDYWWSSYITYMGLYDWTFIDCDWILRQFSDQPFKARQMLKEYHSMSDITIPNMKCDVKI